MTALPSPAADSFPGLAAPRRPHADDARAPERLGLGRDPRAERRAEKRRLIRLAREANAAEHIGRLPEPMEDIILILAGTYHGWDILAAILELAGDGVSVEQMFIATLGFNRTQTDHLAGLLDRGKIQHLTFIVSEMFRQKNPREFQYLADTLTRRGRTCAATRNHAKLMLLRLSDGRHIVTHGSLNLRRCNSFEQIVITQDRDLFEFFARFIQDATNGKVQA